MKNDFGNKYRVGALGARVAILNPPRHPMTKEEALSLAAWLYAMVTPTEQEWADVLHGVMGPPECLELQDLIKQCLDDRTILTQIEGRFSDPGADIMPQDFIDAAIKLTEYLRRLGKIAAISLDHLELDILSVAAADIRGVCGVMKALKMKFVANFGEIDVLAGESECPPN